MLHFSTGALLLLPWFGGLVHGEVGNDFTNCKKLFYLDTPPEGISVTDYKPICQLYKNQYHFASLYNSKHRTPLYSAYIVATGKGRPSTPWMGEPQLASSSLNKEMKEFKKPIDNNLKDSQAVDDDYKGSGYTRGHLAPSSHQKTDDRAATFTLTNIVPQREGSNGKTWAKLERDVLKRFNDDCKPNPMYVITGVMPYASGEHKINDRVTIPEYLWSAYCCPSKSDGPLFPTYAAVGRNDPKSENDIVPKVEVEGYDVKQMPLTDLEGILEKRLNIPKITLFKGQCKT